jgi:hypothetical protein
MVGNAAARSQDLLVNEQAGIVPRCAPPQSPAGLGPAPSRLLPGPIQGLWAAT